ncbi:hypothetical protein KQI30_05660 [Clostridium bornimense]|uniref:hypothetical protein n=1 Tax=Clostridium bornimense TaxID=1216932 RepID=UPI001C121E7C|nr:hypothetical protein [Clostridium bornimense]MBU5315747.1 hypothetical protein [Clostridium bornimense]
MTHKKTYSRVFIILQEMKKNLGISADKIPNGYVKLEIKNTKCKICFYVQNLKPIAEDYKMLLLSGDKNDGKAIDLGKAKIDSNGKCEINIEKSMDNLSSYDISIDKVIGAAIAKVDGNNIDGIMCGFSIKDIPEDWTKYKLVKEQKEYTSQEQAKETKVIEKPKEIKKVEEQECKVENKVEPCEEEKKVECEDRKHEKKEEESYSTDDIVNPQNDLQEVKEEETAEENGSKGENTQSVGTTSNTENTNSMKSNDINFDAYEGTIKENLGKSFFRGASGEFFEYLVSGLEEVEYIMPEIKKCKWYKIRVKTLDDLYYITDYRKYSMIYYPMVNNYPYICKYGHYLFGYKLDENDNLKYMLYAVPGTKHPYDQPYGGKTGYVMWLPMEKGKEGDKDPGYWIMFYDFKDATVCVPAKKE